MRSIWFALCLLLASTAHAGVVTMVFTASGFAADAPTDPVSGTLTWRSQSQASPIEELLSIDLAIAGHTYGLGEIGFDGFVIGGLVSSIETVSSLSNANDFLFSINPVTEEIGFFAYGVQGVTDRIWSSGTVSADLRFEGGGAVPEPGTFALAALALVGIAASRRRK